MGDILLLSVHYFHRGQRAAFKINFYLGKLQLTFRINVLHSSTIINICGNFEEYSIVLRLLNY